MGRRIPRTTKGLFRIRYPARCWDTPYAVHIVARIPAKRLARPTPTTCRISTRDPEARVSVGCPTDAGRCAREVRLLARFHPASPARRETWHVHTLARGALWAFAGSGSGTGFPRNGSDAELVATPQREAVLAHHPDASRSNLAVVLGLHAAFKP
jgi:hypothetical protein